ncbi:hypothetical protein KBD75_00195 [Candidatus Woesebacteria bacterium]|nr:hypothetical protein [Candidatus Woesebacteria bacterium]
MSTSISLSKLDVAKRQLEHSVRLLLGSGDPTILHLIICSCQELLRGLCKEQGVKVFIDHMMESIKPEKRKEVTVAIKGPYNFMKHADRDPANIIKFYPESNEYAIWDCISMYQSLTGEVTGLMMAYRGWFFSSKPELLVDEKLQAQFSDLGKSVDPQNKRAFLDLASQLENIRVGVK